MRDFVNGPEAVPYDTPAGRVDIRAVDGETVYVTAGHSAPSIVIRGVSYSASAHFTLVEGQWSVIERNAQGIYARRVDNFEEASRAGSKSIHALFQDVVERYAAEHVEVFDQAAAASLSNNLRQKEGEIDKLEQQLAGLMRERSALLREEEVVLARLDAGAHAPKF